MWCGFRPRARETGLTTRGLVVHVWQYFERISCRLCLAHVAAGLPPMNATSSALPQTPA
jgi:hypothetical protein